jgi:hypothetical protein
MVRAPGKAENVCPPLARRVNVVKTEDPQGRKITTINSSKVTLAKGENVDKKNKRRLAT